MNSDSPTSDSKSTPVPDIVVLGEVSPPKPSAAKEPINVILPTVHLVEPNVHEVIVQTVEHVRPGVIRVHGKRVRSDEYWRRQGGHPV